jgi:SulP family sulfate permease
MFLAQRRSDWFGNVRGDALSGLLVALALIPEAIAFSIIAGVDPKIGLYASFSIAVVIAFTGGRPGMISAATGAMALLMVDLVKDHGLQYLFATTIATGVIQIVFGYLRLGRVMRFVSKSVMIGFVNALAILIFMAQLPELRDVAWLTYPMVAIALAIIYLLPRVTTNIPSPLVAIVVLSIVTVAFGFDQLRTVSDMGQLPSTLPVFLLPDIPLNLETLRIILPYALPLAVVGLLESLLTASLIDDFTDTTSDKNRECKGQGAANVVTGFLGGMAGCAMIGQSMINVKTGGRGRLSTLIAGVVLLILVVGFDDWVGRMPMAALVAVMIMVSIGTFNWTSIKTLRTNPPSSSIVMLATVGVVVLTHNLAYGVLVGVLLSGIFFAWKISQIVQIDSALSTDGTIRTYEVHGQIFFASTQQFSESFDFHERVSLVRIDVTHAHLWDVSAVSALDRVVLKFRKLGIRVELIGMNDASSTIVDRFAVHDKVDDLDLLPRH